MMSFKKPSKMVGYLNAALEGDDAHVFLLALLHVVQAQGGISKLSGRRRKISKAA